MPGLFQPIEFSVSKVYRFDPTMLTTLGTKFKILADLWTFDFLWTWSCQFCFDLILLIFWSLKKDLWFLMTFDFWFRHLLLFFSNTFLPQNLHTKANSYFEVSTIRKSFRSKIGYSPLSTRHIKLVLRGIYFLWTDWKPDKRLKFVNDTSGERILQEGTFICVLVEQNGA